MPPKKKRVVVASPITRMVTRTRSGAKQQIKEGDVWRLVDTKKLKAVEITPPAPVAARSHKKFGKFRCLTQKETITSASTESLSSVERQTSPTKSSESSTSESSSIEFETVEKNVCEGKVKNVPQSSFIRINNSPSAEMQELGIQDVKLSDTKRKIVSMSLNSYQDKNLLIQGQTKSIESENLSSTQSSNTSSNLVEHPSNIDLGTSINVETNLLDSENSTSDHDLLSLLTSKPESSLTSIEIKSAQPSENSLNANQNSPSIRSQFLRSSGCESSLSVELLNISSKNVNLSAAAVDVTNTTEIESIVNLSIEDNNLKDAVVEIPSERNLTEKNTIKGNASKKTDPVHEGNANVEQDNKEDFINEHSEEEIISQQLSNLEFAVVEMDCNEIDDEPEFVKDPIFIENLDSEFVMECIDDDIIPICSEQEVVLESDEQVLDNKEYVVESFEVTDDSNGQFEEKKEDPEEIVISDEEIVISDEENIKIVEELVVLDDKSMKEMELLKPGRRTPKKKKEIVEGSGEVVDEGRQCDEKVRSPCERNTTSTLESEKEIEEKAEIDLIRNVEQITEGKESIGNKLEVEIENEILEKIESESEVLKKIIPEQKEDDSKNLMDPLDIAHESEEMKLETEIQSTDTESSTTPTKFQAHPSKSKFKHSKKKTEIASKEKASDESSVRRSSRIKSIQIVQKQKSKGHGLVKHRHHDSKEKRHKDKESSKTTNPKDGEEKCKTDDEKSKQINDTSSTSSSQGHSKPVKVKSRWRRSSELEQTTSLNCGNKTTPPLSENVQNEQKSTVEDKARDDEEIQRRLKQFVHLKDNLYLTERISCKEAKKMTCDCFLTEEEITSGEYGCGEDCLNRLLMIECGSLCAVGERCTNKRFQKGECAPCEVFRTDKKGLGITAAANIPYGEFIMEYVGEVLDPDEFDKRATEYSKDKNRHYYFMSLRADAVIDATQKGNISRFINHSCDPNAETQKWTVNGELRIGFFSKRTILAGEEITFDYQFQRYGKEAQKCYCEAATCRGWLGEEPEEEDDDEDEDDEEEDEEEEDEEGEAPAVPEVERKEEPKVETFAEVATEEKIVKEVKDEEVIQVPQEEKPKPLKKKEKKEKKKILRKRLPRKDIFEDLDLDEEIDTLQTTGLKNQAHTLKLSRLMVRAKEPAQRTKLLRVLRRGELPCRRLFLDYHGLRLIHGWMTDAQHMVKMNKKLESLRLEILQTLATLPIPNKSMLHDSKVLLTVEKWSKKIDETLDSDSNSPKAEVDTRKSDEQTTTVKSTEDFQEDMDISPIAFEEKDDKTASSKDQRLESDYETEIVALGVKLLDEWSGLKEVFKIPKKERIEQMKEHEREADRKYRAGLGLEQDALSRRYESRYGSIYKKYRKKNERPREKDDHLMMLNKYERRKMFALHYEQQDIDRRRKQQEIWRQHEQRCITVGVDPKLTAPFDPNQGFQCVWNPQTSQWHNISLPVNQNVFNQGVPLHFPSPSQNLMPPHLQHSQTAPNTQLPINKHIPPPPLPNKPVIFNQQPPLQQMQFRPPNINIPFSAPPNQHLLPNQPIHPQTTGIYTPSQNEHMPNYQMANTQNPLNTSNLPSGLMSAIHAPHPGNIVNKPPPLPTLPYQDIIKEHEDPSQVKFLGPIPPPAKLPPKWKCAKDKYGRPYYYHIRFRRSQWEPPVLSPEEQEAEDEDSSSSSDTSTLSSDSSSEESDSDDEIDDAKLLLHIKKKFKMMDSKAQKSVPVNEDVDMEDVGRASGSTDRSLDDRLVEEFSVLKEEVPQTKRRRVGLVQEIIISPRTEEDKLQFKEDVKRYKANKEKLKRQKEMLERSKKNLTTKPVVTTPPAPKSAKVPKKHKISVKAKLKEMTDTDAAKKIKEAFRSSMAMVMVSILNPYRKPDCKEGRITNTDDFKHLARKLTHFVMLKELKHCQNIEELTVTESVKSKAKEFVRKYMSKFGETYLKPKDEADFY